MLTLPIKKKWFDMILSGEKKEEYREMTPYYQVRFKNLWKFDQFNGSAIREIRFQNGYSGDSPSFVAKCTLKTSTGKVEWGAEPGKKYYILKIHEISDRRMS